jgi:hypothetical protein
MSIPLSKNVISTLQDYLGIELQKLSDKQVFYTGNQTYGSEVLVCTPQSKLYSNGRGWIDITTIQTSMLERAKFSILAFRLEGNKIYFLNFHDLQPYLINEALIYNAHEGDHWKLYIWPDRIQVLGNSQPLSISPNDITNLKAIKGHLPGEKN